MKDIPLGQETVYAESYNPNLLVPVERQPIRRSLDIQTKEMRGVDIWNVYEASWLNPVGKPQIACIELAYSANSPCIVESKSLKLYFNSMNQTKFDDTNSFLNTVKTDLANVVGSDVQLRLIETLQTASDWQAGYECIDDAAVTIETYTPAPELLNGAIINQTVKQHHWVSHLFKTNCMVTGQPDWGSVFIDYEGPELDPAVLLTYLISFRNHQAFHEPSCEMIFDHLTRYCQPLELSVYCRYTRRGGIDINPYRTTTDKTPPNLRMIRQ